jgi:hypothetical protein
LFELVIPRLVFPVSKETDAPYIPYIKFETGIPYERDKERRDVKNSSLEVYGDASMGDNSM